MNKNEIPISACLIVQDEEKYIEKAVQNLLPNVSEIVVVDGGSKDKTVQIIKDLGCVVFEKPFEYDFSKQRNYAASMCSKDWILWCDADEYFSEDFYTLLPTLVMNPIRDCGGYQVFRISKFDNEVVGTDFQWRLLNRRACTWVGKIHEGVHFNTGFSGFKLPQGYSMQHEHTMARQLFNNKLYNNINNKVNKRPGNTEGMESHDDKWIDVKTDRDK